MIGSYCFTVSNSFAVYCSDLLVAVFNLVSVCCLFLLVVRCVFGSYCFTVSGAFSVLMLPLSVVYRVELISKFFLFLRPIVSYCFQSRLGLISDSFDS